MSKSTSRRVVNEFRTPAYLVLFIAATCLLCACPNAHQTNHNTNVSFNSNSNANSNANAWGYKAYSREAYERDKYRIEEFARTMNRRIGPGDDDGWIWVQAYFQLRADEELTDSLINVDVENGNVTLSGFVLNADQKMKALETVRNIQHVKSINDRLVIAPRPTPTVTVAASPSSTSVASPMVSATVTPTPANGFDIDREVQRLRSGATITEVPTAMEVSETRSVVLVLSPEQTAAAAIVEQTHANLNKRADTVPGLRERTKVEVEHAKYSKFMEAKLSGQGFEIKAVTPERQPVTSNQETKWIWDVKALTSGDQFLYLTMNAIFENDGTKEKTRSVNTLSKIVQVRVSWGTFFSLYWQWIVTAVGLPLVIAAFIPFIKWAAPEFWQKVVKKKEAAKTVLGFTRKNNRSP
jgi:hypothetical protein